MIQYLYRSVTGINLKVDFTLALLCSRKGMAKPDRMRFQGPSSAWCCVFVDSSVLAFLLVSVDLFMCCALHAALNKCPEEIAPRSAGYQAEIYKIAKQHTNLSVALDCKTAKPISLSRECRAGCREINLCPVAMATYFKPSLISGFHYNLEINNRI